MANQLFNFGPPVAQVNALQWFFEDTRWQGRFEWLGLVGHGAYGVCVRVRQHFADPANPQGPARDFILKQANSTAHEPNLRREMMRLGRVAGGIHIVRPILLERSPFYDFDAVPAHQFIHPMVRACIAMAYPRPFQDQAVQSLEIPNFEQEPGNFTHTDLHGGNVLLGDTNVFMQEHQITPILKLIDFGVWLNAAQNN
ncbi:uncharacterized protein PG998_009960 [Apiospora kogelbergensis]|uniref:uncharacterized protein n=1 Tax=Apiospora kogelbergensis TaxID=1337665 RepID=UPI00312E3DD7